MCVVSMVGDYFNEKWKSPYYEEIFTGKNPIDPSSQEFEALKKEVEEMKQLLKRAKEYDEKNNEPDCEIDEKMKKLKEMAAIVGIDLDDVLKKHSEKLKEEPKPKEDVPLQSFPILGTYELMTVDYGTHGTTVTVHGYEYIVNTDSSAVQTISNMMQSLVPRKFKIIIYTVDGKLTVSNKIYEDDKNN
jgi:hypothetical protein